MHVTLGTERYITLAVYQPWLQAPCACVAAVKHLHLIAFARVYLSIVTQLMHYFDCQLSGFLQSTRFTIPSRQHCVGRVEQCCRQEIRPRGLVPWR